MEENLHVFLMLYRFYPFLYLVFSFTKSDNFFLPLSPWNQHIKIMISRPELLLLLLLLLLLQPNINQNVSDIFPGTTNRPIYKQYI